MQSPAGVNGGAIPGLSFDTAAGWHPLIWESNTLFSAIRGWSAPEISVQIILCALAVAPDDVDLRLMLLAGLKARYARVTREPNVFPRRSTRGVNKAKQTQTAFSRSEPEVARILHADGKTLLTLWSRLGSNQRRQWPKPRHADEHLIDVTPAVPGMCQARQLHGITARTLRPRNA
jgi:hypothetical protein